MGSVVPEGKDLTQYLGVIAEMADQVLVHYYPDQWVRYFLGSTENTFGGLIPERPSTGPAQNCSLMAVSRR